MTNVEVKRDCLVSVRLTKAEAEQLDNAAKKAGRARSDFARGIVTGKIERPQPELAAAGRLLAICHVLLDAANKGQLPPENKSLVEKHAREIIQILLDHAGEEDAA
ncbi:MAG: plasmid mobilization protein [Erythrobacter sp.]